MGMKYLHTTHSNWDYFISQPLSGSPPPKKSPGSWDQAIMFVKTREVSRVKNLELQRFFHRNYCKVRHGKGPGPGVPKVLEDADADPGSVDFENSEPEALDDVGDAELPGSVAWRRF